MAVGADTFLEDQSQVFVTQQDLPLPELLLHFTASHMDPYLPSTSGGWLQFPREQ